MNRETPPRSFEVLDELGDDIGPHLSEAALARLVLVAAVLTVTAVVSMILQGTMRVDPVPAPYPSALPVVTSTTALPEQPPALEADDPTQPLQISLVDDPRYLTGGLASFLVRVCVSAGSAGVATDKVRVPLSGWLLRAAYYGDISSALSIGLAPEFPNEALLGPGECETGYVTFPFVPDDGPHVISYVSKRFTWSWYLG